MTLNKLWCASVSPHRFDIIKKLGQGTYGKVQLGINKETGQEVAIKTIKKSKIETEADLIRIRREVQIMSSVQHPNIIHIYEGEHYDRRLCNSAQLEPFRRPLNRSQSMESFQGLIEMQNFQISCPPIIPINHARAENLTWVEWHTANSNR